MSDEPTEVIKNDGQRCPRMTGAYERELRDVLSGTPKGVEGVIRSCPPEEQARMRCVLNRPFWWYERPVRGWKEAAIWSLFAGIVPFPSK